MKAFEIIPFDNQYAIDFYELNIEWLKTHFFVEPFDEEVLSKPKLILLIKVVIFFLRNEMN